MSERCKYCERKPAATGAEWDADEDRTELCGRKTPGLDRGQRDDATYDCKSHEAHVAQMRLSRATVLLNSARLTHLMNKEYQNKLADEIGEFLAQAQQ